MHGLQFCGHLCQSLMITCYQIISRNETIWCTKGQNARCLALMHPGLKYNLRLYTKLSASYTNQIIMWLHLQGIHISTLWLLVNSSTVSCHASTSSILISDYKTDAWKTLYSADIDISELWYMIHAKKNWPHKNRVECTCIVYCEKVHVLKHNTTKS